MSKAKIDTKQSIIEAIQSLAHPSDLSQTALSFFETLGYSSERQLPLSSPTYDCFEDSYIKNNLHTNNFKPEKALSTQWKYVDFLFQITAEELKEQLAGFSTQKIDNTIIESYLFFVVELEQNEYSRSQLSQITREINKLFSMPVMILFKHNTSLTLAIINRRLHKKDQSKDVLEKVTLIKDISTQSPHRAHIEILFDLSLPEIIRKYKVNNFVELHQAWQKTLDTKELNKNFYKELSNWYFWAIKHISFPGDIEKNEEIRNATSLIRLLTRIIFIWFIKEKGLVDEKLFTPSYLKQILHNFDSNSADSSFYQAILQNLFFATLNQKISERKFAQNGCQSINKKEYGVKTLYRYDDQYTISKDQVLELFKPTPFLNGGLFDCLDKEDESLKVQYADGFSRNPGKRAEVPDFLFFGSEVEVDLNSVYDTKKNKYTSRGLITILDSFKFTITENSPIEEEIALDPELLGKVFENLLASYNPETQTTARKSTGSFYTPREIVHYMVDESLLAYFKQKLEDIGINDSEEKLRSLIGYNEDPNPFNPNESQILIQAVDTCKILDPACGSGAFPMGILQKLVHILHKLDPNNQLWKEKQLQKARQLDDSSIREKLILDIDSAFKNNELDYGRKLYLIENCIYGVDIQPIAIQIAKLRFFISLIIDQKKQSAEENYGIRALPNLETKFVCANTLIGLDKPDILFKNNSLEALERKLEAIRHEYFSSKTREQKITHQKKDNQLRKEISQLLIIEGWKSTSAEQVSGWDPYNQNASSPFFDTEWMFGIKEGFNIVIGNPPYGNILKDTEKSTIKKNYSFSSETEIASPFIEKAVSLLSKNGILSYIITYAITFSKDLFMNRLQLSLDFNKSEIFTFDRDKCRIFESMTQTVSILKSFYKDATIKQGFFTSRMFRETPDIKSITTSNTNKLLIPLGVNYNLTHRLPKIGEPINEEILCALINSNKTRARDIINVDLGRNAWIRTSGNYWYNAWDKKPYESCEIKKLTISEIHSDFFLLLMNSSIFYFWFRIYGDGRHMNMDILQEFPIPDENVVKKHKDLLHVASNHFMEKLFSVFNSSRNCFNTSNIKSEIDFIDLLLGKRLFGLKYSHVLHLLEYDKETRTGTQLKKELLVLLSNLASNENQPISTNNDSISTKQLEAKLDEAIDKYLIDGE